MSGFTEKQTYDDASAGGMTLVMIFKSLADSVGFLGASYDINCNDGCLAIKKAEGLDLTHVQNSWTRVYMGYSHARRAAFAYISVEKSGRVFTMEWPGILHNQPMQRLELILGGLRGANYLAAPGYYADIRTSWKDGAFLGSSACVEAYFAAQSPKPQTFSKLKEQTSNLYEVVDDRPLSVGRNDANRRFSEESANYGAEDYAWWGWF